MGSALRIIDTQSGSKKKSVAVTISPDTMLSWVQGSDGHPASSSQEIVIADPGKRLVYLWKLDAAPQSPPRKVFEFSSQFPDDITTTKLKDVSHWPGEGPNGGWIVLTEWVQWGLLKSMHASFFAGMIRVCRLSPSGTLNGMPRDVWGHAGAFVDVPMGNSRWKKMFCFASRVNPREQVRQH